MNSARAITVHFSCRDCGVIYCATQQRGTSSGLFECRNCAVPVHDWSGAYNFVDWRMAVSADRASIFPG